MEYMVNTYFITVKQTTNIIFFFLKRTLGYKDIVKFMKNSIFLKNGKTVISVENLKFSRSWMTKQTLSLNSSRKI